MKGLAEGNKSILNYLGTRAGIPGFFKSGMRANILLIICYKLFPIGWDTSESKPVERTTAALQVGSVKQEPNPKRDAR